MGASSSSWQKHDKFAKPLEDEGTATAAGGVLTALTYVLALAYLIVFIARSKTGTYPTSTTIGLFPGAPENPADDVFMLPPTNCLATSGCWVLRANTSPDVVKAFAGGTSSRQCRYYAQGEALTDADRIVYNSPDAVDAMQVIWKDQNFGLSYDVAIVEEVGRTLTVSTKKAATELNSAAAKAHKVYKGQTQFHLVRTTGVGEEQVVDTWTNSVTSEDGTPDALQNACCNLGSSPPPPPAGGGGGGGGGGGMGGGGRRRAQQGPPNGGGSGQPNNALLNSEGGTITSPLPVCSGSGSAVYYQTKITPFVTYTDITVIDPFDIMELWGMLGGAIAVLDIMALATLSLVNLVSGKGSKSTGDNDEAGGAGTEVEQLTAS